MSQPFINARLNESHRLGFSGGPQFNTRRVELLNGRVLKNRNWMYPRCRWETDYALLTDAQREDMRAAFWVCGGGFSDFRFKDWDDFRAIGQPLSGIEPGTTTPAQLIRRYEFGGVTFDRIISLPLNAVIRRTDTGAVVAAVVAPLTGLVTPAAAWEADVDYTWTGEFDVRACFENDFNPFNYDTRAYATCPVSIVESRG